MRVDTVTAPDNSRIINVGVETPKYIPGSEIQTWEKEIGIRTNTKIKLNVSQISIMEAEPSKALAALAPGGSKAAGQGEIRPADAITTIQRSFEDAKSALLNSSKSVETICENISFSLKEKVPIIVTCELARPAAIPTSWRDETTASLTKILGVPVLLDLTARETRWLVLSLHFKNGREKPTAETLPCEQLKPPAGLKAGYELVGYSDGMGDAAENIRLTRRRQTAAAGMLADCGIDKNSIHAGPVTPVLSKTPADAGENRRVDVWIAVAGFGGTTDN